MHSSLIYLLETLPTVQTVTLNTLADVDPGEWNALLPDSNPFLRHEFLHGLEIYNCVGKHVGWLPQYFLVKDETGHLLGAMPAYLKHNSFGEFVFDWSWAAAYENRGMDYYPKLVSSIPFTPVTGPRLLLAHNTDQRKISRLLIKSTLDFVEEHKLSSAHWLFVSNTDKTFFETEGLLKRLNYQYHWCNQNYESFDHYLSFFRSRNRKKTRREREHVTDAGISTRVLHGHDMSEALCETVYGFYQSTFLKKGNYPALTLDFFKTMANTMGQNMVVVLAEHHGDCIAGAINFRSDDTLYGRYWGCTQEFNSLHFEVCFYKGIEYCIDQQLQYFEPGAQGEHKITRGFLPVETWSTHWIGDGAFRTAIAGFLQHEQTALRQHRPKLDDMSPFRTI